MWREMLDERGVDVDHTAIYRWVERYAPEIEKRLRWYWNRPGMSRSWRVGETYIQGTWGYPHLAVDKEGPPGDPELIQHLLCRQIFAGQRAPDNTICTSKRAKSIMSRAWRL